MTYPDSCRLRKKVGTWTLVLPRVCSPFVRQSWTNCPSPSGLPAGPENLKQGAHRTLKGSRWGEAENKMLPPISTPKPQGTIQAADGKLPSPAQRPRDSAALRAKDGGLPGRPPCKTSQVPKAKGQGLHTYSHKAKFITGHTADTHPKHLQSLICSLNRRWGAPLCWFPSWLDWDSFPFPCPMWLSSRTSN